MTGAAPTAPDLSFPAALRQAFARPAVSSTEAARFLSVTPQAVGKWIRAGRLPATRPARPGNPKPPYAIQRHHLATFEVARGLAKPRATARVDLPPLTGARPLSPAECLALIHQVRWPPEGRVPCPRCGATGHGPRSPADLGRHSRPALYCRRCGRTFGRLHSTLFHRTSIPLPYWFYILYHTHPSRYRHGCGTALARRLPISITTVRRIIRALDAARRQPQQAAFLAALTGRLEALAPRVNALDLALYSPTPRGISSKPPTADLTAPRDDPLVAWYLSRIDWGSALRRARADRATAIPPPA